MNIGEQITCAAWQAPTAITRLRGKAKLWLGIYILMAAALLGGFAALLISNQDGIRNALLGYLFPKSWHFASGLLIDHLLASQTREVLINASISGTLVLLSLFLFPVKEKLSAAFETESQLIDEPTTEFPLWYQGLEEVRLVILYLTVYMVVFWIGYHPLPWRKHLATGISYGFLVFTFSIDFIAPVLQRHKRGYSQIVKTLLMKPVATIIFGAIFALPPVLAGKLLGIAPNRPFAATVLLLFGINLLSIVGAAIGGTYLGSRLFSSSADIKPTSAPVKVIASLLVLGLFSWNVYFFGSLGSAIHHKSQILKCDYSIDWSSIGINRPKATLSTLANLIGGKIKVGVYVDLNISNPTQYKVALEKNRLVIVHGKTPIATTELTPFTVQPGASNTQKIEFALSLEPSALLKKGRDLFSAKDWKITLYLQISDSMEFPIYLK